MSSAREDEDLERAIALSLQDQSRSALALDGHGLTLRDAIALDSETEDGEALDGVEDTQQGLQSHNTKDLNPGVKIPNRNQLAATEQNEGPKATFGFDFAGIDRKQMEQERLARKRKISISPPPSRKSMKVSPCLSVDRPVPLNQSVAVQTQPDYQVLPKSSSKITLSFPQGTIKKTWAFGHSRTGDDIKLEEVLQKNKLIIAVLSSFQWNIEWLLAKINTRSMSTRRMYLPGSYWRNKD